MLVLFFGYFDIPRIFRECRYCAGGRWNVWRESHEVADTVNISCLFGGAPPFSFGLVRN